MASDDTVFNGDNFTYHSNYADRTLWLPHGRTLTNFNENDGKLVLRFDCLKECEKREATFAANLQ